MGRSLNAAEGCRGSVHVQQKHDAHGTIQWRRPLAQALEKARSFCIDITIGSILTFPSTKAYFKHMQEALNSRGTRFAPSTISLAGRSLSVACQCLCYTRPLRIGETKKQRAARAGKLLKRLRSLAKSLASAQSRVNLRPNEPLAETEARLEPLTAEGLLATSLAWDMKIQRLEARIAALDPNAQRWFR